MKKFITAMLAVTLLLACVPLPALAQSGETEAEAPKTVPGTVRGGPVPAILYFLDRDDELEVLDYADEDLAIVKTDRGEGLVETQFLRFPGEESEPRTCYAAGYTGLYPTYDRLGEPTQMLAMNTRMEVLEELEDCYYVQVGEETGFVADSQAVPYQIQPQPQQPQGPASQDGGDITMASFGRVRLLSEVTEATEEPAEPKLGAAQCKVPGIPVVKRFLGTDEQVDVLEDQEYLEPIEGYLEILDEDTPAYIRQPWVQQEGDPDFTPWDGYAGFSCELYDNYLLWGKKDARHLSVNTALTVLWDTGEVAYVRLGEDEFGFVRSGSVNTYPVSTGGSGDSGSSGSSGPEWTPAVL